MKYEFDIIGPEKVSKYIRDFRSLEERIEYPLEDGLGNFRIIHGENYHTFFTQQGFKTRFVAIKNENKVIGSIAGIWKHIKINDEIRNLKGIQADVITGGFPCQPFSVAGKRKGTDVVINCGKRCKSNKCSFFY